MLLGQSEALKGVIETLTTGKQIIAMMTYLNSLPQREVVELVAACTDQAQKAQETEVAILNVLEAIQTELSGLRAKVPDLKAQA